MIIHVQKPQPTAEQILKVLLEQKKIEEKYSSFGRTEKNENFRLMVINDLLAKIEKIR